MSVEVNKTISDGKENEIDTGIIRRIDRLNDGSFVEIEDLYLSVIGIGNE